jgi:hypothetical protein
MSRPAGAAAPWHAEDDPHAPLITWTWGRPPPARAADAPADPLGLALPWSVDRSGHDRVRVGQSYSSVFAVTALPRRLSPEAFHRLAVLPGVHMAVANHPQPRQRAKAYLSELARSLGVTILTNADEHPDEEVALRDLRRHLQALAEERTAHHLVGWTIRVSGGTPEELAERVRTVRMTAADLHLGLTRCDYQHWEGVLATTPLGMDPLRMLRATDTPTLARLLPRGQAPFVGGRGAPILYGRQADGTGGGLPVVLDRFQLPSPHQAIIAATGGGKTYFQCLLLLQRYAHGGCTIAVLDPKGQEYRRLIDLLGGTYVVLSEQAAVGINPLAVPHGAAAAARLRAMDLDVRVQRASLMKQLISTEMRVRGRPLSGRDEALIEEGILAEYERRGMTADPATLHAEAPTFRDVARSLQEQPVSAEVQDALMLFCSGVLGRMLGAARTLSLAIPPSRHRPDVGVVGMDLSGFVQGHDETLKRVVPPLAADYLVMSAMHHPSDRVMEVVIDEAWTVLATEAGGRALETLARIGRSLRVGATVITQQVREFQYRREGGRLDPNLSGQTYLDNCETVVLLRQVRPARGGGDSEHPVQQVGRQFGLTPGEMAWLSRCRREADGVTGLLIAGRTPIPLWIPRAPEPIHTLILRATGAPDAPDAPGLGDGAGPDGG